MVVTRTRRLFSIELEQYSEFTFYENQKTTFDFDVLTHSVQSATSTTCSYKSISEYSSTACHTTCPALSIVKFWNASTRKCTETATQSLSRLRLTNVDAANARYATTDEIVRPRDRLKFGKQKQRSYANNKHSSSAPYGSQPILSAYLLHKPTSSTTSSRNYQTFIQLSIALRNRLPASKLLVTEWTGNCRANCAYHAVWSKLIVGSYRSQSFAAMVALS